MTTRKLPNDRSATACTDTGSLAVTTLMDQICAGYADTELELLADFLHRTTNAGRDATDELGSE